MPNISKFWKEAKLTKSQFNRSDESGNWLKGQDWDVERSKVRSPKLFMI